jgi:3-mercaptopyruvate sulfurtransferase SseA
VDPAHEAVIVSSGGLNADSALAFVMLERMGHKRISLLSDSVDEWGFAGLPLEKAAAPAAAARDYPLQLRAGILAGDSREARGPYPKIYLASGKALPAKLPEGKAIHVPFSDLVGADGKPKAAKDIWSILEKAGLTRYAEIVTVSDEPGEAAANYFILKLMGFPDVKVLLP